uniref:Four helix bundle protein n=1 Tax=uncultured bacterium contig00027 TaxID=1181516 RepID=A0A806K0Y7_9BACT|nr:hypothetical protein [uncultured bacterium contig00027]
MYWLELLHDTGFLDRKVFEELQVECMEISKLLSSSINTLRKREINNK